MKLRIRICSLLLMVIVTSFFFGQGSTVYAATSEFGSNALLYGKPIYYISTNADSSLFTDGNDATYGSPKINDSLDVPSYVKRIYFRAKATSSSYIGAEYGFYITLTFTDGTQESHYVYERPNVITDYYFNVTGKEKMVQSFFLNGLSPSGGTRLYEFDLEKNSNMYIPIPYNFVAESDSKKINLTWDDAPDDGFTGYDVYMNGQKVNSVPIMNKFYTATGLTPDVTYSFYVRALYGTEQSQPSVTISKMAYGDPLAKPVLTAQPYEEKIDLEWQPIIGATNYRLYQGITNLVSGMALSYSHTGLSLNTTYQYFVEAIDKYGRVVQSDILSVSTREPPPPVIPVLESTQVEFDTIALKWTQGKTPYTLYQDGILVSDALTSTSYGFFGTQTAETMYSYKITYVDAYGRLLESNLLNVTTKALPQPIVPKLSVSSITDNSARLTWDNVGISYKVLLDGVQVATTAVGFYPLYNLTPETTYNYQVYAIDNYNREVPSNTVTFQTLATPAPTPPPPPPEPPPPVSNSGNPDLNKANDYLVQGANDSKNNSLTLIAVIIAIFILIFAIFWLVKLFKRKMNRTVSGGKSSGPSGGSSSARPVGKPLSRSAPARQVPARTSGTKTNIRSSSSSGRTNKKTYAQGGKGRNFNVQKNYKPSSSRRFKN